MAAIKLVAIAKDEAAYLAEWIYHHLSIGIDAIDIYLNGITDNSYQLMRLINRKHPNVNFYNANILMKTSLLAESSFQSVIYRYAWSNEKRKRCFTHLAFLDIDEYLVSSSFGQNVSKMLNSAGDFDILSNLWYTDLPCDTEPFSRFFVESQWVQKMSIVKSVGRLKAKIGVPIVHNFTGAKRDSANLKIRLSDGTSIQYSGLGKRIDRESRSRSIGRMEPWFVYHRIFRSHDEYCASLMRGRQHRSNDAPIKDNRSGFTPNKNSTRMIGSPIQYNIKPRECARYQQGLIRFINRCNIGEEILEGQNFVRTKFKELEQLVDQQPELLKRYSSVFKGTVFECQDG